MIIISKMAGSPSYSSLNLTWYPNVVRFDTIGDGSCFFHAIALAYCQIYRLANTMSKMNFVRDLRYQLSKSLGESESVGGLIRYDLLSRGKLREMSKDIPNFTLDTMQKELNSSTPVDNLYLELCANVLRKDIYLLDYNTKDVYRTGKDSELLIKNRDSIVILYKPGHYELVGTLQGAKIITLFPYDHPFIRAIKSRN